jgi:hypothetical protein
MGSKLTFIKVSVVPTTIFCQGTANKTLSLVFWDHQCVVTRQKRFVKNKVNSTRNNVFFKTASFNFIIELVKTPVAFMTAFPFRSNNSQFLGFNLNTGYLVSLS